MERPRISHNYVNLGGMIGSTSITMQSHTLMTSGYLVDGWDQVLGLVLVLCAKLLKGNGQRAYRSSYQHLTENEVNNPEEVRKRDDFDRQIKIKLGPATKLLDFDNEGQTPVFQLYEDDDDGAIDHAKEAEEEPTPYQSIITLVLKLLGPEGTRWYQEL